MVETGNAVRDADEDEDEDAGDQDAGNQWFQSDQRRAPGSELVAA